MIKIKPRIVVTGATGKTGSVVSNGLLQAGYPVRAMVHREDGRSARLKALGAGIVVTEMSDVKGTYHMTCPIFSKGKILQSLQLRLARPHYS
jgi:nucleoside-diphosphate-sugar epimerase